MYRLSVLTGENRDADGQSNYFEGSIRPKTQVNKVLQYNPPNPWVRR